MQIENLLRAKNNYRSRHTSINYFHPCIKLKEISRCIDVFYQAINDNSLFKQNNTTQLIEKVNSIVLDDTKIKNIKENLVCYGPNSLSNYITHFHCKYDGSVLLKNIIIDFSDNKVETQWSGNNKIGNHLFYLNDYCDRIMYIEF